MGILNIRLTNDPLGGKPSAQIQNISIGEVFWADRIKAPGPPPEEIASGYFLRVDGDRLVRLEGSGVRLHVYRVLTGWTVENYRPVDAQLTISNSR